MNSFFIIAENFKMSAEDFIQNIRKTITKIRKERGYTQAQMADLVGFEGNEKSNQIAYSRLETGEVKLTVEMLYKIAEVLNIDLLTLVAQADGLGEKIDNLIYLLKDLKSKISD